MVSNKIGRNVWCITPGIQFIKCNTQTEINKMEYMKKTSWG